MIKLSEWNDLLQTTEAKLNSLFQKHGLTVFDARFVLYSSSDYLQSDCWNHREVIIRLKDCNDGDFKEWRTGLLTDIAALTNAVDTILKEIEEVL